MTLLLERDLTAEERQAIADEPRPGVWIQDAQGPGYSMQPTGDGRALTQHETNILIGLELWMGSHYPDNHDIEAALGYRGSTTIDLPDIEGGFAFQQRGGIHDDPLIRLIAFRKWGERDRRWCHACVIKRQVQEAIAENTRRITDRFQRQVQGIMRGDEVNRLERQARREAAEFADRFTQVHMKAMSMCLCPIVLAPL
jgi:hypothetical protein